MQIQGRHNRGFTLVELLIVIAVISVLMLLGATNWVQQQKKARDARRGADLEQIRAALEMYRTEKGSYPDALPTLADPANLYMKGVPDDPLGSPYNYTKSGNGYTLQAPNAETGLINTESP